MGDISNLLQHGNIKWLIIAITYPEKVESLKD